ncbi:hypothetical protein Agub_g13264, partial [Astrephomene gubernaculifera]
MSSHEHVVDLRDAVALDTDAAGTIYALIRNDEGDLRIVLLDGRQEVLEAQQRQGSLHEPVRISGPSATQIVRTHPAIDFDVRGLQVAPSGRYLLLHGYSYQDSSVVSLAVVDLHGGQPLPAATPPHHHHPTPGGPAAAAAAAAAARGTPARGGTAGAGGAGGAGAGPRPKQCRLHPVDPELFSSRPGLLLYQASWHPHSEEHLVLLTSDSRLRLY